MRYLPTIYSRYFIVTCDLFFFQVNRSPNMQCFADISRYHVTCGRQGVIAIRFSHFNAVDIIHKLLLWKLNIVLLEKVFGWGGQNCSNNFMQELRLIRWPVIINGLGKCLCVVYCYPSAVVEILIILSGIVCT